MQSPMYLLQVFKPLFFFLFISNNTIAQCVSSNSQSGTIFTDEGSTGVYSFVNPDQAKDADNKGATASSLAILLSGTTHYLKITGFNFSIPSYASICGVAVSIRRRANGLVFLLSAGVRDNEIKVIKNGAITGDDRANKTDNWPGSLQSANYGGSADNWGTTLSPADVNASNFGIAISAKLTALAAALPSAEIDDVKMTVYYYATPLPVTLGQFRTTADNNGVNCTWTLEQQEKNTVIDLQRATGIKEWKTIAHYSDFDNSNLSKKYNYRDLPDASGKYYYRLRLISENGNITYSNINAIFFEKSNKVKLYPTVASQAVYMKDVQGKIQVCNSMGQIIDVPVKVNQQTTVIAINSLGQGVYFVRTQNETFRFIKAN